MTLPRFQSRTIGLLCLAATSVGWGVNWPAMKMLLMEWPPMFARGIAGLAAAAILSVLALLLGQSLKVPRPLVGRLVAAAFLNVFAWMGFASLSLRWLTAGQGALLVYTMPAWTTLFAWPFLGKRPTGSAVLGLVLCGAGIGMLFGGQDLALGADAMPGVLSALGAAILFALGTVVVGPLQLPPLTSLAWQVGIGCAPMLAIGLLFENPDLDALTPVGAAVMVYMSIVPMGVCYLSWFAALRRLPPSTASITTLMTPVIGVLAAVAMLGEPFGLREGAALVLTLGGVALALRK